MVTLYTSPSCTSCRKARAWLEEHNIPFETSMERAAQIAVAKLHGE